MANGLVLVDVPIPNKSASWNNVSPKVSVDYRIDQTLLYATYSRGYIAGLFNVNVPTDPGPVNPEKLDAYEIGHKSDFLDSRLRVNTALYWYKIKDLQVQTVSPSSNGSTILQNAATATLKGIDLSVLAAVSSELSVNVGASYSHAKYGDFANYGAVFPDVVGNKTVFINASGKDLARDPKTTFTLGADYTHSFANGSKLVGSVKGHHSARYFWDPSNLYAQQAYWLVNASLGYTLPRTPITASLWGTNLTNQYYNTILNASAFGIGVFDAPPRMYGFNLTWRPTAGH
jgi:iron complex outermembrane receptor protein